MMVLVFAAAGLVIGGALGGFPGCVLGLFLGWLVGDSIEVRRRLSALEDELGNLRETRSPQKTTGMEEPQPAPPSQPWRAVAPAPKEAREAPVVFTPVSPMEELPPAEPPSYEESGRYGAEPDQGGFPLPEPIRAFFTGGNLLVKTGIVILFFGVSFLVKYAAQHGMVPVELRLAGSSVGGVVLLAVGWRLRGRRLEYALALQGGGIGVLYITVFAAFRLYPLIPALPALLLLVGISVLCGALAVLEETPTLALFGISGGFLAPLLASTGHGSHVFLFGYYAVLNAGIIGIAWFKSWRPLNLAGFVFTFAIGALWGARYYRPEFFATTEPFLVLFFLMYLAVAVLFALRQPPRLRGYLDGTLIFGTPVVAFALQARLVADYRYGLAWSALVAGLLYLSLAAVLFRRDRPLFPLAEAFTAFGAIYLTLAVPLAFDGRWTASIWAVEGAAIAWTGIRQTRQPTRLFGIVLQFAAGVSFFAEIDAPVGQVPLLNSFYLGCLLLAIAGLWSGYTLYRNEEKVSQPELILNVVLMAWGVVWWLVGGFTEMSRHLDDSLLYGGELLFASATCAACHFLERRLAWRPLIWPALMIVPALWCLFLPTLDGHPLQEGGTLGWPLAMALTYLILYLRDEERREVLGLLHGGALWLLAVTLTWELKWQVGHLLHEEGSWGVISRGIVPALFLLFLGGWGELLAWPVRRHREAYHTVVAAPLVLWSLLWVVCANLLEPGDSTPFPWLPLLNSFDLAVILSLAALFLWHRRFKEVVPENAARLREAGGHYFFYGAVFIWLNAILARALHYWGGVPFEFSALFDSRLAQTSFAVFWSVLSLCVMVAANRRGVRSAWLAGGVLLGMVVLKLFVIDLAGQGTVERIVSFVAVGVLLLVIGWFSPVPPSNQGEGK